MRVLLLGATGTIGQATARALVSCGHEVVCLVREKSDANGEITPAEIFLNTAGVEIQYGNEFSNSDEIYFKIIRKD